MSNEIRTTVTISRTEYDRLQREARTASSISGQVAAMSRLQEAMANQNRTYEQQIRNMEAQAISTLRAISGLQTQNTQLRNEIANTVANQNRQLQAMASRHRQEMAAMNAEFARTVGDVRNELHETSQLIVQAMDRQRQDMENQMRDMERDLRGQMRTMQGQIDSVDQTVQGMQKDDNALRSIASTYLNATDIILRELQDHRTEQFAPGCIQALVTRLENINNDLSSDRFGVGAAARAEARALHSDIIALRLDVCLAEQRWELHRQTAIQVIDRVEAQIEASRDLTLDGEEESQSVDYWSYGALTRLQDRLNAIREETNNLDLSTDQMEALQDAAAEISEEIAETVTYAAIAFRSSRERRDIIADLERELYDGGRGHGAILQVFDDDYQGSDPRAGFRARFENPQTGLNMVITIRPEIGENGELTNSLTYDVVSNGTRNAAFATGIIGHIVQVLSSRGLICTPPQQLPQGSSLCNDSRTRFNVEHWRQEKKPDIPSPSVKARQRTKQPRINNRQAQRS